MDSGYDLSCGEVDRSVYASLVSEIKFLLSHMQNKASDRVASFARVEGRSMTWVGPSSDRVASNTSIIPEKKNSSALQREDMSQGRRTCATSTFLTFPENVRHRSRSSSTTISPKDERRQGRGHKRRMGAAEVAACAHRQR